MVGITKKHTKAQCIITTVVGNGASGYTGDGGQATSAEIAIPNAIAFDVSGNFYVADSYNNVIRKVNTSGIITTVAGNGFNAGTGQGGYSGNGGQATAAELYTPTGVSFDNIGNLYIADFTNNVIRKVNIAGIISTIAGNGTSGYSGDGEQATNAKLYAPRLMTFDSLGNLYFSDDYNYIVRKVNMTTGIITTVAGNGIGGYSGDGGQATDAQLYGIGGVCFDKLNNFYIADEGNNVIRKVNTSGIITTVIGTGTQGYNGDEGLATAAELYNPSDIKMDTLGNLYITDAGNNVIRKVNTAGIITTIAGTGTASYSGDGGSPLTAQMYTPINLAFDTHDNLYVVDQANNRIRKISHAGSAGIEQVAVNSAQVTVWPNPNTGMFEVNYNLSNANADGTLSILDLNGKLITTYTLKQAESNAKIDASMFENGVYMYSIQAANTTPVTGKLVIIK